MNYKESTLKKLQSAYYLMRTDLQTMPDSAFNQSFGEKTRTVADVVFEVNQVNDHVCITMRGETPWEWPEGWLHAPENLRTKEACLAAFEKSAKTTIETVEGFTEEQFMEPMESDGKETTRFERCNFMALHTWYHSGQLNYIQTMLGDDVMHW